MDTGKFFSLVGAAPWFGVTIPAFLWMMLHLVSIIMLFTITRAIGKLLHDSDEKDGGTACGFILGGVLVYLAYWQVQWYAWNIWYQILVLVVLFIFAAICMGATEDKNE